MYLFPDVINPDILREAIRDEGIAFSAADGIAKLGDPKYLDLLLEGLRDEKVVCANALIAFPGERTEEALHNTLSQARAPSLISACKNVLRRFKEAKSQSEAWQGDPLEKLSELTRSDNIDVRVEAILSLGAFGSAQQAPMLIQFLEDSEPRIQEAAKEALKRLRTKD